MNIQVRVKKGRYRHFNKKMCGNVNKIIDNNVYEKNKYYDLKYLFLKIKKYGMRALYFNDNYNILIDLGIYHGGIYRGMFDAIQTEKIFLWFKKVGYISKGIYYNINNNLLLNCDRTIIVVKLLKKYGFKRKNKYFRGYEKN